MSNVAGIESIPTHITGSDIPLGSGKSKRCRRALRCNTYTLTAANAAQQVLPQADTRAEAWISAFSATALGTLYIAASQAGAQGQAGGCLTVPFTTTAAAAAIEPQWYPLNTTDTVWVSGSSGAYPITVSVQAIYEEDE